MLLFAKQVGEVVNESGTVNYWPDSKEGRLTIDQQCTLILTLYNISKLGQWKENTLLVKMAGTEKLSPRWNTSTNLRFVSIEIKTKVWVRDSEYSRPAMKLVVVPIELLLQVAWLLSFEVFPVFGLVINPCSSENLMEFSSLNPDQKPIGETRP